MESATETLKSHLISHSANFAGFRHCGPNSLNFAAKLSERVLYGIESDCGQANLVCEGREVRQAALPRSLYCAWHA